MPHASVDAGVRPVLAAHDRLRGVGLERCRCARRSRCTGRSTSSATPTSRARPEHLRVLGARERRRRRRRCSSGAACSRSGTCTTCRLVPAESASARSGAALDDAAEAEADREREARRHVPRRIDRAGEAQPGQPAARSTPTRTRTTCTIDQSRRAGGRRGAARRAGGRSAHRAGRRTGRRRAPSPSRNPERCHATRSASVGSDSFGAPSSSSVFAAIGAVVVPRLGASARARRSRAAARATIRYRTATRSAERCCDPSPGDPQSGSRDSPSARSA